MLHRAAQFVAGQLDGRLPETSVLLRKLPGIGEYTAAAIASIAFGEAVACVDGNVERVLRRVRGWDEKSGTPTKIRAEAARLLDADSPGNFNQAMMELGATVCLPRSPLCEACPVRDSCVTQGEHPVAASKKMMSRESAYAFVHRNGRGRGSSAEVLLEQRSAHASLMPSMWELPPMEPARAPQNAAALTLRHSITNTNYYVTVYRLDPKQQKQLIGQSAARQWHAVRDLHALPLTGLARKALKRLKAWPGYDGNGIPVALGDARIEFPE
jgi:A/G-specific adenine glycosylase